MDQTMPDKIHLFVKVFIAYLTGEWSFIAVCPHVRFVVARAFALAPANFASPLKTHPRLLVLPMFRLIRVWPATIFAEKGGLKLVQCSFMLGQLCFCDELSRAMRAADFSA